MEKNNKDTRKYFEKRRKDLKDKGKRRNIPELDSDNNELKKKSKPKGSNCGAWKRPPEKEVDKVIHLYIKKSI